VRVDDNTGFGAFGDGALGASEFRQKAFPANADMSGSGALSIALDTGHHYADSFARTTYTRDTALGGAGALSATARNTKVNLSGGGTLSATAVSNQTHILDTFTRADSTTSLGANWTNRLDTVGISSNEAYAALGGDNEFAAATHNTLLQTNNMRITLVPGLLYSNIGFLGVVGYLGCNAAGQGVQFYWVGGFDGYTSIYSQQSWADAAPVQQAVYPTGQSLVQDVSQCVGERVGSLYTMKFNGATLLTWNDTGNVIPRDANHRLCGIGTYVFSTSYQYEWRVSSFAADDI
jgi:hypothetical protein